MAITSAFQADDAGSIPVARSDAIYLIAKTFLRAFELLLLNFLK